MAAATCLIGCIVSCWPSKVNARYPLTVQRSETSVWRVPEARDARGLIRGRKPPKPKSRDERPRSSLARTSSEGKRDWRSGRMSLGLTVASAIENDAVVSPVTEALFTTTRLKSSLRIT